MELENIKDNFVIALFAAHANQTVLFIWLPTGSTKCISFSVTEACLALHDENCQRKSLNECELATSECDAAQVEADSNWRDIKIPSDSSEIWNWFANKDSLREEHQHGNVYLSKLLFNMLWLHRNDTNTDPEVVIW